MLNRLFNAISNKLDENFSEMPIYFNNMEQNFQKPCFFIRCTESFDTKLISNRHKIFCKFEITYFPEGKELAEKNNEIFQKIIDKFELISFFGKKIRATNTHFLNDESLKALKIFMEYNFCIKKTENETEKMQSLFY